MSKHNEKAVAAPAPDDPNEASKNLARLQQISELMQGEAPRKKDSFEPHFEEQDVKKKKKKDPFEELRKEEEKDKERAREISENPAVRLARKIEGGPEGREGGSGGEGGGFRGG